MTFHHYYGDLTRKLFLSTALLMLVTLPIFAQAIDVPFFASLGGIVVVSLVAGYMNPVSRWSGVLNVVVAGGGLVVFERQAIVVYGASTLATPFFLINQILAVLFLFAFYYSVKTLRGMHLAQKHSWQEE